jgi:O-antigen ligase
VGGVWRPGGTLEYSPALALLVVSGLPPVLAAMCRGPAALRVLASASGAIGAVALALSGSRTGIALAALVCAAVVAAPRRTVGVRRATVATALVLLASVGLGAQLLRAGGEAGYARAAHASSQVAAPPGSAHAWFRRAAPGRPVPARRAPASAPGGGFWHGRLHTWRAALDTFADRPLAGAGADAFLAASARHQREGPVRFAHDLPLELGAELGVPGFALALALYAAAAAALWRARRRPAAWLLGPAAVAFLAASLLDWPWHLAGSGAVWAVAVGALAGASSAPSSLRALEHAI